MSDTNEGRSVETPPTSTRQGPLVFVSHDTRDFQLAEQFSRLLTSVSAGVLKSFRSSDKTGTQGIEYGTEWYPKLMETLGSASDVVCLLTPRSVGRPWILYEAGVAKGKLNTPVHGLALGIPLSSAALGPFAQFQNVDDTEQAITKLVMQLISRVPGADPDRDAVQMQVAAFRKRAESLLVDLAKDSGSTKPEQKGEEASVAKIFEEIKVMFQDLPSRLEGVVGDNSDKRPRRHRRLHPMMILDVTTTLSHSGARGAGLLVFASLLRDEVPWLYEPIMDLYRALRSGQSEQIRMSIDQVREMSRIVDHPVMRDLYGRDLESYELIRQMPMMIERLVGDFRPAARAKDA